GLTTRDREPKPALQAVSKAFDETPMVPTSAWPKVSIIICAYNAAMTLRECLEGVTQLNYPNYEVIVVDDGSTDNTSTIASVFNVNLIRTENGGLSRARNLGLEAATGDIVAYLDSDAYPDRDWLTYLAYRFKNSDYSAVGGPNIHPGTGDRADCVANAPGGPMHVLLSDHEAEHIPGCNMAFRREQLKAIGGFDSRFRIAGDDVDVCWRVQQQGWKIGYHAGALVWHHSRPSIRTIWKQQLNYGRAEALLERKWPEKYSRFGHAVWHGRIYGPPLNRHALFGRWRVYHGTWGTQPFQSIYAPAPGGVSALMLMPEWVLGIGLLALLSILGFSWTPLLLAIPLFLLALGAFAVNAGVNAAQVGYIEYTKPKRSRFSEWCCTSYLHMLQPLARLAGRIQYDLHPWVNRGSTGFSAPTPKTVSHWSQTWGSPADWLASIERKLLKSRVVVVRGGDFDRWDLEAWGGFLGATRLLLTVEEHGSGQQLVRLKTWPVFAWKALWILPVVASSAVLAAVDSAWLACGVLSLMTLYLLYRPLRECSASKQSVLNVVNTWKRSEPVDRKAQADDHDRSVVKTQERERQPVL
ncbi:MAG: glycosyltransferase, partial [Acidobacteriota bacterium]